jgi:hypothetical protein
MGLLLLGQQQTHDHEALAGGSGRDHGRGADGGWQNKSPNGPAASPAMILKSSQLMRLKSLQDHGSSAGGEWQNKTTGQ